MIEIAAVSACLILVGLSIFQVLLILGAPLGKFAWGGSYTVLPNKLRIASLMSIILYIIFSLLILSKAGLLNMAISVSIIQVGMWVLTGYFLLGAIMNGVSRSTSERRLMTPVAAMLAVLFLYVTLQ